jgi:sulfide:quinone oxidoreductase
VITPSTFHNSARGHPLAAYVEIVTEHVVILGAGFGGLELAARLSESAARSVRVTLIDQNDGFVFGFSKLDVLFGRHTADEVRLSYRDISLPSVEFRQERITSIDPRARHVVTDAGSYDADILVVALGADYDPSRTPGFVDDGFEFYSVAGAQRLSRRLASFTGGDLLISILGVPFKCPPAPYEAALLMHDYLVRRGLRSRTQIEVITPMPSPIPVSTSASGAIVAREIRYTPSRRVHSLDVDNHLALMNEDSRHYNLFIGVPVHRVPDVVAASGLTDGGNDGWVAVDAKTLRTSFPSVYAIGDCADAPVPRAGVFAEAAARTVADHILATLSGGGEVAPYGGQGACYVEFGDGLVAKVDADFLTGPTPVVPLLGPSRLYADEKAEFGASRRRRWFAGSALPTG